MEFARRLGFWGSAVTAGLLAAFALAWFNYRYIPPKTVTVGPWQADPDMGTGSADPFIKARTALTILVAVRQSEFVYYFAKTDSAGRPLDGRCSYRLTGEKPQAQWWSVVLYNQGGFLDANPARRFSVNASDMTSDAVDVRVTQDATATNVLPVANRGPFNLVMRLYTPDSAVIANLASTTLPRIERGSCAA
jgi:hypothetical protein